MAEMTYGALRAKLYTLLKDVGCLDNPPIHDDLVLDELEFDELDIQELHIALEEELNVTFEEGSISINSKVGDLLRETARKLGVPPPMTLDEIVDKVLDRLRRLLGYDVVNIHAGMSMAELVPAEIATSTYKNIRKELEAAFGITMPVGRNFAVSNAAGQDDVINGATTVAELIRIVATELGVAMPDDKPAKPTRQLLAIGRTEESECITVKELIEFLNGMPGDSPIVLGPLDTQWNGNLRYAAQTTDGSKVFLTNTKNMGEIARDLVYKFKFNHDND